jgi:site-specific recombinase XerD
VELLKILYRFKIDSQNFLEMVSARPNDAFFISEDGEQLQPRSLDSIMDRLSKKTNINISCHMFRRTCARNLLLQKKDLVFIQNQLGHESIEVTRKYIQGLTPEIIVQVIQNGGSAADQIIRDSNQHRRKNPQNSDNRRIAI